MLQKDKEVMQSFSMRRQKLIEEGQPRQRFATMNPCAEIRGPASKQITIPSSKSKGGGQAQGRQTRTEIMEDM